MKTLLKFEDEWCEYFKPSESMVAKIDEPIWWGEWQVMIGFSRGVNEFPS